MEKGYVTKLLVKIRDQDTKTLIARFKHLVGAQAIRVYLAAAEDPSLDIEVRLTEEELLQNRFKDNGAQCITTYFATKVHINTSLS